jgi:hexosaminidase
LALASCGGVADRSDDTLVTAGDELSQADVARIASSLQLKYTVLVNVPDVCPANAPWGLCLNAKITLKNNGGNLKGSGYAIYFSNIRRVLSVDSTEFTITPINGDLHKMAPVPNMGDFRPGETKEIPFSAEYWMLSETDVMPRFYVAAPGKTPVAIANTDTENQESFVAPFTSPLQTRRHPADQSVIATAATRFAENAPLSDLGDAAVAAEVVPAPMNLVRGAGSLDLQRGVKVAASGLGADAVAAFKARIARLGVALNDAGGVPINVSIDPANPAFQGKSTSEAYTLTIDAASVTVVGGDARGAFWGLQTVAGLLPGDCTRNRALPQVTVAYDAPRYAYRGAQMDLSRNFHPKAEVLKVLDQMAAYKLNTLHMHLADDEGWRLEIPGLPELTSLGARRCHDLAETSCLLPQLGSGPDADTSGTGFLSRSDFIQIVAAAKARSIEIVPEFDMPGHARAAIKSMQLRASHGDSTYLLSDPDDASSYRSIQYYNDNAINACRESTYAFVGKVMDEVHAMFTAAGATLKTWHVGGDETAAGAWTASPICNALYASGGPVKSVNDVHGYFIRRVNALAMARGFGIRGWSDGLRKSVVASDGTVSKVFLDPASDLGGNNVSTNWWGTLFWWDNAAYTMANAGFKVILTSPDFLYLDHPYEADPKERGYYWATRFTNMKKLFGYISGNLPSNAQITKDRMGGDYTGAFAGIIPLTNPENVIGMEGPQWGETMRSDDELDYMVFPRMLALAERAWHRAAWEPADGNDVTAPIDLPGLASDWQRFANVLGHKELAKLGRMGVDYRIEVPGATIQGGKLAANVAMPGLAIQYQDAKGNWRSFDAANPPSVTSTAVRAVAPDGRAGRSVPVP